MPLAGELSSLESNAKRDLKGIVSGIIIYLLVRRFEQTAD